VSDANWEEVRPPVAGGIGRELDVPTLLRHAGDDQTETGPGIEPLVDEVQLAGMVADQYRNERGAEAPAASI
jgi:hypothetical protein